MAIYADNVDTIGRTPLVRINRLTNGLDVRLLAKIEGRNPAYSVKCHRKPPARPTQGALKGVPPRRPVSSAKRVVENQGESVLRPTLTRKVCVIYRCPAAL